MKFTHSYLTDDSEFAKSEPTVKVEYRPIKNAAPIDDATIQRWVEEGVEYLRDNPESGNTFFESGDKLVNVYRDDENDNHNFFFTVAKRVTNGSVEVIE
jgi:hypothetical protein